VFKVPSEGLDPVKSLVLALQRLFVQLQTSPDPVSTIGLTQSFGWDSYESFVQHDAQEFERVLLECLENNMKEADKLLPPKPAHAARAPFFDAVKRLFCGQMETYVRAINVEYESTRQEEFWDVQLNVKGCKNLRGSFENLVATELMEGDNRVRVDEQGLQDAHRGCRFSYFPPVLHMQLKRFEFDFVRETIVKVPPPTNLLNPLIVEYVTLLDTCLW
jgi:ubiquitin carboxyl-terminal hydrolase 7